MKKKIPKYNKAVDFMFAVAAVMAYWYVIDEPFFRGLVGAMCLMIAITFIFRR